MGHCDYIRAVKFHQEYPWILSSSDDQTIRIWNWQSRECISVMTGHSHYVMYAEFHPTKDLILSCSLDQTIRVWDTSGLRKKKVNGTPGEEPEGNMISRFNSDSFGVVKFVLEGHDRCVNYANFHPTLNLIVSGSDDRQIKIWRYNDNRAWEVDTLRGHTGNVSSVIFHPTKNYIISNSEDHTIRIWDSTKRVGIQKFHRSYDRFWCLAIHPEQDLLVAGHDSGLLVFKIAAERPAIAHNSTNLFYIKDRYIRSYSYKDGVDVALCALSAALTGKQSLELNPYENSDSLFLLFAKCDNSTAYEIYKPQLNDQSQTADPIKGYGRGATFTARNRICVLENDSKLSIRSLDNAVVKPVTPPPGLWVNIFPGGNSGRVILKSDEKIILFETTSRRVLGTLSIRGVK